jgi:hypothetical protein
MHLARIKRHGYPELKKDAYQSLEKMPHEFVDEFIKQNCHKMFDEEIAAKLSQKGIKGISTWNVKYRRRKLGIKKYSYGEIQKHKAWVRLQAIKKYGNKCELCGYELSIDIHHIKPKSEGGAHDAKNLMVVCPNCHSLITRKILWLGCRKDIPRIRKEIKLHLKNNQPNFG